MDLFEYGWSNLSILFARATCLFNDWSVWGYSSRLPAHAAAARSRDRVLVEHELAVLTPVGGGPLLSAHAGRVDMSASNLSLFK